MAQQIASELLLIVALMIANGVFAMTEIAVVSARKPRLQNLARRGSRRAAAALRLAENPDRFLSTVQIGITLIGVLAGAFGGATIANQIDEYLERIPSLAAYSETIGVGSVVLGITYLSLVIGELVPKRLALNAPEKIAVAFAPAMHTLSRLAAPAVGLLSVSTRAVLWLIRVRPRQEPAVTEEELRMLLRQGMTAGTIAREEHEIVERVFRLGDRSVRTVMTPRVEMEWLDSTKSLEELRAQVAGASRTWFPIAAERVDAITGVMHGKDLWAPGISSVSDLARITHEPLFVPENASAYTLLQGFRETRNHLAIVIDEFGGVEGIVTPTDLLEALVGELPQRGDVHEPMIVRADEVSWSIDAATDLDEVKIALGVEALEGQKEDRFQTIAGYLIDRIGHHPQIGDSTVVGDYRFQVLDMDGRRIDRILVRKVEGKSAARG